MIWSNLYFTPIGDLACRYMDANNCAYHNKEHIAACYRYLARNKVPYDVELDCAILFHDAVYDKHGDNEERSAELVKTYYDTYPAWFDVHSIDIDRVVMLIMDTCGHVLTRDNEWILKADLHSLTDPHYTISNFLLLKSEGMYLYGKTEVEVCQGTLAFMQTFRETMLDNFEFSGDQYWNDVINGIDNTIKLANMVIEGEK